MSEYYQLSVWQLTAAGSLMLLCAALSLWWRLHLERELILASVRMVGQLVAIGLILNWVFSLDTWYSVLPVIAAMTVAAGLAAVSRSRRHYPGQRINSLLSLWISSWSVAGVAIFLIVQVRPWYKPQFLIPLLGMILGNSLNGVALALERFTDELMARRDQVESALALGATRWEAARVPLFTALRTGMVPMLNSMTVAGLVSLPGMMTGQILSGISPLEAVKYQILILFLLATSTTIGTFAVVLLGFGKLSNSAHQFLYERIGGVGSGK